jgi:hypothetical protein
MESRVYFDPRFGIVVAEVVGAVTTADLDALRSEVVAHGRVHAAGRCLIDLSHMDPSRISPAAIRDRAQERWGSFERIAHVAPQDAVYGLARMYDLAAGDQPGKTRASFRDRCAAEAWLSE